MMRDYVALVERLREARKHIWTQPQIELYPIMYEAADAIEELVGFIQQSERDRDGGMNDGRLIDAVRLQGEMMELIHEGYGLEDMVDAVIEAPTVDAVPVVRCKDCKHRPYQNLNDPFGPSYVSDDEVCPYVCWDPYNDIPDDNSFCDRGERR